MLTSRMMHSLLGKMELRGSACVEQSTWYCSYPFFTCYITTRVELLDYLKHAFKFFASDKRIKAVRKMIMAVTTEQRKAALNLLLPYQRSNFEGIFCAMDGLPVMIRLLDPPLHEFLPEGEIDEIVEGLKHKCR